MHPFSPLSGHFKEVAPSSIPFLCLFYNNKICHTLLKPRRPEPPHVEFKNEKRAIPPAQCGRTASSLALPQRAQDSSLNVSVNHTINQSHFSVQQTGHGVFPSRAQRGEGEHVRYLVNSNANIVSAPDKRGPATGGRRTSAALVARDRHSCLNSSLFPHCLQNSSLYSFWLPHCAKESVFFSPLPRSFLVSVLCFSYRVPVDPQGEAWGAA